MSTQEQYFQTIDLEYLARRYYAGELISKLAKLNPRLTHLPGFVYLCRMPNNLLKIGTTQNLDQRMKALGAALIYSLPHGETLELQAHYELQSYRVPSRGEFFLDAPAVFQWFEVKLGKVSDLTDYGSSGIFEQRQRCSQCRTVKHLADFGTLRTSKSGYYSKCRDCRGIKLVQKARKTP